MVIAYNETLEHVCDLTHAYKHWRTVKQTLAYSMQYFLLLFYIVSNT